MKSRYAFQSYAVGAASARIGDEISGPALLFAGHAVTGSAASASTLLAGLTISAVIGGPLLGALLDRSARPGRLLAAALALYAVALVLILLSLGRLPLAWTLLIAVCAGLLGPALSGGWTAQLPRVVPREGLPRANALDAMTFSGAGLLGPALAGAATGLAGGSAGLIAAAVLIGLALPSAWTLPRARVQQRDASVFADLAAGFRAIRRCRPLARATSTSVISCVGEGMLIACIPLLGEQVLGGAHRGAFLLSLSAASALAANALLARHPCRLRPDAIMWCGPLVLAAALLLAASGRPWLLIAAMVIAGCAEGPQLTALFAIRHREAPGHLRGQIFTTGASLKITGFALGAAVAGPLATWSLSGALLAAAACQAAACAAFKAMRWVRLAG